MIRSYSSHAAQTRPRGRRHVVDQFLVLEPLRPLLSRLSCSILTWRSRRIARKLSSDFLIPLQLVPGVSSLPDALARPVPLAAHLHSGRNVARPVHLHALQPHLPDAGSARRSLWHAGPQAARPRRQRRTRQHSAWPRPLRRLWGDDARHTLPEPPQLAAPQEGRQVLPVRARAAGGAGVQAWHLARAGRRSRVRRRRARHVQAQGHRLQHFEAVCGQGNRG